MSFISLSFFIFFPIVTGLYFLTPYRFRWIVLLVASCIFYMAFIPAYILILFGLIAVDYLAGILFEKAEGRLRYVILLTSITSTVGVLFVFKYFNFFNANLSALAQFLDWHYPPAALTLALPLGLSFHTFQSLSYVIEVYQRKQPAEHHLGIYALYVMFYPQLVAGPIERPQHLLHQFYENHDFEYNRVKNGLIRIAWGFFKKMVVADHLALVVDKVFAHPTTFDGLSLLVASIFFTLELYFDFSAYCDIALGAAQVIGFTLMENFNRPFASRSMAEWWRRWHISLSSWFRDYFYYPLILRSKKKITPIRIYAVILLTFLVTGFWHGANWTYGAFGVLHGFYIVFGAVTERLRKRVHEIVGLTKTPRLHHALQISTVFSCAVIASIFFRATDIQSGWYITTHLFSGASHWFQYPYMLHTLTLLAPSLKAFALTIALAALLLWSEFLGKEDGTVALLSRQPVYIRWGLYWGLLFSILILSENTTSHFIYFQF